MSADERAAWVERIAQQLGETDPQPLDLLHRIAENFGLEFCDALLKETLDIEAQGGLMIKSGARRRTPGGVFFYLARGRMNYQQRRRIFGLPPESAKPKTPPPPLPVFTWDERAHLLAPLLAAEGAISTVKITLIGRPGAVDASRKDLVITAMAHAGKFPSLPKGVPTPPETPTHYTVYIAAKQWGRVAAAIQDEDDALIVEGACAFDPELGAMAVFATSVTTKKLEIAKREKAKPSEAPDAAPKASKLAAPLPPEAPPAPPPPAPDLLPGAPPEVNRKLAELYAAASLYRQKVATLSAKPAGQQAGLEMTRKLLQTTEAEIAALEKQYGG